MGLDIDERNPYIVSKIGETMLPKTVDDAQRELEYDVEEETIRQIELGYPKYVAMRRAQEIILRRRRWQWQNALPTEE